MKTCGWIPMNPLSQSITLGDYCKISNDKFRVLGNIRDLDLVEGVVTAEDLNLNSEDWKLQSGAKQVYCESSRLENDTANNYSTNQVLEFSERGSLVFHGQNPICDLIVNWSNFVEDITVKLSQSKSSFRQIYVITGVARLNNWGLRLQESPAHN